MAVDRHPARITKRRCGWRTSATRRHNRTGLQGIWGRSNLWWTAMESVSLACPQAPPVSEKGVWEREGKRGNSGELSEGVVGTGGGGFSSVLDPNCHSGVGKGVHRGCKLGLIKIHLASGGPPIPLSRPPPPLIGLVGPQDKKNRANTGQSVICGFVAGTCRPPGSWACRWDACN